MEFSCSEAALSNKTIFEISEMRKCLLSMKIQELLIILVNELDSTKKIFSLQMIEIVYISMISQTICNDNYSYILDIYTEYYIITYSLTFNIYQLSFQNNRLSNKFQLKGLLVHKKHSVLQDFPKNPFVLRVKIKREPIQNRAVIFFMNFRLGSFRCYDTLHSKKNIFSYFRVPNFQNRYFTSSD